MHVRMFLAPYGRRWRVWLVQPSTRIGERQASDRRQTPVEEVLDPPLFERRRAGDRRTTPSAPFRATPLPDRWRQGWLVFECEDGDERAGRDRRRLAPVPAGWRASSERELAKLWARAELPEG
jgi:hypothetical protein